jgi:uncharacterized membrane protein
MKAQHHYIIPCGLLLIVIGLFIRYHIGRRRFNRRGIGGLQHFPNYHTGLLTMILETLMKLIGTFCLLTGLFLLALTAYTH